MLHKFLKRVLNNKKNHAYLKGIYKQYASNNISSINIHTEVGEIADIGTRVSAVTSKRLNLLVPALSSKYVFGGISTALDFFNKLLPKGVDARIIITDEFAFSANNNNHYDGWQIVTMYDEDTSGRLVVACGDRYNKTLPIRQGDVFISTAWWTAVIAKKITSYQKAQFPNLQSDKFIYLIQDFEPGFYSWSSRYALAESTYHYSNVIPVFNTSILKDYFLKSGYSFSEGFFFEPCLNPSLRPSLLNLPLIKAKKIIVYGRPSVARNAFEVLVMSLRMAVKSFDFTGWEFYSAGEQHGKVELGSGLTLVSLGKLSLEKYADILRNSYVGISLMISPHPSYPPLEMAAFGLNVITNRYANKNLSEFSSRIRSIAFVSPECIAEELINIIKQYNSSLHNVSSESHGFMSQFLVVEDSFSGIIPEIRKLVF